MLCNGKDGNPLMRQDEMKQLLEVGVLLSSERDINRLLEKILACVMNIAR